MAEKDGAYTRVSGSKQAYSYCLTYAMHNDVLHWSALVTVGSTLKGRPNGTYAFPTSPTPSEQEAAAENFVRTAIERLADVDE